jgi:hypothetical protein
MLGRDGGIALADSPRRLDQRAGGIEINCFDCHMLLALTNVAQLQRNYHPL